MKHVTQELVRSLFRYNPKNGELIRLTDVGGAKVGDVGGCLDNTGYILTSVNGKVYQNHRLVFIYFYGCIQDQVDHINGIRSDNRIENLRAATHRENIRNSGMQKNNTSGVKGVCWSKKNKRWIAKITTDGERVHLGSFTDLDEAAKVVKEKREELHGEFANHGY